MAGCQQGVSYEFQNEVALSGGLYNMDYSYGISGFHDLVPPLFGHSYFFFIIPQI